MKRSYMAIAEQVPGETTWWISFPSFPGITSAADSAAEIMAQARDAWRPSSRICCGMASTRLPRSRTARFRMYDPGEDQNHLVILVPHVELVAAVGQ